MPRPRVTFSRNGITSSGPSGPPKESTSSASLRPAGAGSAGGGTPPVFRAGGGRRPGGGRPPAVVADGERGLLVRLLARRRDRGAVGQRVLRAGQVGQG